MTHTVGVVGLGYVGLPLALICAKEGDQVYGIDINQEHIDSLIGEAENNLDLDYKSLRILVNQRKLILTSDFSVIRNCNIVIICVPTPLYEFNHKPNLEYLEKAILSLANHLKPGTLIILESTVATGTTRNFVIPTIIRSSKLEVSNIDVVYSPERIDPMNKVWTIRNTPKLIAGLNKKSEQRAIQFYGRFIENLVSCKSLEIAETAKLLENSFRLVNISLINELSIFCEKIGIEVNEVVSSASTKPYGFIPFYPSLGAGGHCIPVDPIYLANRAKEVNAPIKLIELSHEINQNTPSHFVNRIELKLNGLTGKKILIIGVAYKPNISDVRETPVKALVSQLRAKGAVVSWHDNYVREWDGETSVELDSNYDLAFLATQHEGVDLKKLGDTPLIYASRSLS